MLISSTGNKYYFSAGGGRGEVCVCWGEGGGAGATSTCPEFDLYLQLPCFNASVCCCKLAV